jgi:hypothetical protein
MRMIDFVGIGDILAGVIFTCYQSYRNEAATTVSSSRASFITLRPKAAPGLRRIFAMFAADTLGDQQMAQEPENEREEGSRMRLRPTS